MGWPGLSSRLLRTPMRAAGVGEVVTADQGLILKR